MNQVKKQNVALWLLIHVELLLSKLFWQAVSFCNLRYPSRLSTVYMKPLNLSQQNPLLKVGDRVCFQIGEVVYLAAVVKYHSKETQLVAYFHRPLEAYPCPVDSSIVQVPSAFQVNTDGDAGLHSQYADSEKIDLRTSSEILLDNDILRLAQPQKTLSSILTGDGKAKHSTKRRERQEWTCHNISIELYRCQPQGNATLFFFLPLL